MSEVKAREFWLNSNPDCRGWSEGKPDEWLTRTFPAIHVIEYSAYQKAVDALKKIEQYFCACSVDDEIIPQVVAREVLKDLGETP